MEHFEFPIELSADRRKCLQEAIFLKHLFTDENISEMRDWYNIMKNAIPTTEYLADLAQTFYEDSIINEESLNYDEAIENLSLAIRISPSQISLLTKLLIKRAELLMGKGEYKSAIIDFHSILLQSKKNLEIYINYGFFEKFGKCLKELRDEKIARDVLQVLKEKFIEKRYFGIAHGLQVFYKNFALSIDDLLRNLKDSNSSNTKGNEKCTPYMGYTTLYPKIKQFSVACSLIESKEKSKILANREIPKTEIIATEKPYVFELLTPNVQCNHCQKIANIFLPCFECHSCSYCSVECKYSDYDLYHKYECKGMKMMVLPLIDGTLLLRLLIRGLTFLKRRIFSDKNIKLLTTAVEIQSFIFAKSKQNGAIEYFNILNFKPKYDQLSQRDFNNCVSVALRLTIFIKYYTTIINDFLSDISGSLGSEIDIFIASLIMRHAAQLKTKAFHINFDIVQENINETTEENSASIKNQAELTKLTSNCTLGSLKFDNLDKLQSKLKNYINSRDIKRDHTIDKYLQDTLKTHTSQPANCFQLFVNEKFFNCLIYSYEKYKNQNSKNVKQNQFESTLKLFVHEMYKFNQYKTKRSNQTIKAIYPSLSMVNHSCDPNVALVLSTAGVVIGRAISRIKTGEEITISYGVHYKKALNETRRQYLREKLVECNCKQCANNSADYFQKHTFFDCKKCSGLVNPLNFVCQGCEVKSENSEAIINLLSHANRVQEKISSGSVPNSEIFNAHVLTLLTYMEFWGKDKYPVYMQMLRMAKFLAKENYVYDAFEFLSKVRKNVAKFYPAVTVDLFTDYKNCLDLLFDLLEFNINNNVDYVKSNARIFKNIFTLTNELFKEMEEIVKTYGWNNNDTENLKKKQKSLHSMKLFVDNLKKSPYQEQTTNFLSRLYETIDRNQCESIEIDSKNFINLFQDILRIEKSSTNLTEADQCIHIESSIYYNTSVKFNWCDDTDSD